MTQKQTYNGWTNRETWLVNLHFENILQDLSNEYEEEDKFELAELLQESFEEIMEEELDSLSSFISDYLDLGLIHWVELAEHYLEV